MVDKVNKSYKPAELQAAIDAIKKEHPLLSDRQAREFLIRMHKAGWRLVFAGKVEQ